MELTKITKSTLPLAKELLAVQVKAAKALGAQIKLVEATGSLTPDGVIAKSGKKPAETATKPTAGKKTAKKAAKKAAKAEPTAKKVPLHERVLTYVEEKFTDGTFSPKDIIQGMGLDKKYQVPVSQSLKRLCEEDKVKKISRGTYQLAS